MNLDRTQTRLPPPPRKRRQKRPIGRTVAKVLCGLFAIIGLIPLVAMLLLRWTPVRRFAASETEKILRQQGITASYDVAVRLYPLAIELTDVRVESNDGRRPALTAGRVRVRPKLFALLSGKVLLDQIEIDAPKVRLVVQEGKIKNLDVNLEDTPKAQENKRFRVPFDGLSITNADVDLDVDGARLKMSELDVDVTAEELASRDQALEVAVRAGRAEFHRSRLVGDAAHPRLEVDDDTLCSLDARVRVEEKLITVRRFAATGSADLDVADETAPRCDLPDYDKRRVELSLSHVEIRLPTREGGLPALHGHVRARAPIGLAERAVKLPETDGWLLVDADVRFAEDTTIPDLSGRVEAHDVRLGQFNFAHEIKSDLVIRRNVVVSPKTTVTLAGGLVTFEDTQVDPLIPGGKLTSRVHMDDIDFSTLMLDLGVHKTTHVAWGIKRIDSGTITGTFSPLKIDFDFDAKTHDFGIYDRWVKDPARVRMFGFPSAAVSAHLAIRSDGVHFERARAQIGSSTIGGASVLLGFHNELRVDATDAVVDLGEISPVGPVKLGGRAVVSAHVGGTFKRPEPEFTIKSVDDLRVADFDFGHIDGAQAKLDVTGPVLEINGVQAAKNTSRYTVPSARIDFGGKARGLSIDATASSKALAYGDLLAMFTTLKDERFRRVNGVLDVSSAQVHFASGGPEDACGGGYVEVRARSHLTKVDILNEKFASGDADVEFRWHDRAQGISGAEIDVRAFSLHKRATGGGTILGSASIDRGELRAQVVVDGLPLSEIDHLAPVKAALGSEIVGRMSAVAHVSGSLDDTTERAGLLVQSQIEVPPVRLRGVELGSSQLRVTLDQRSRRVGKVQRTRCGNLGAVEDPHAVVTTNTRLGVDGELLDRQIVLRDVSLALDGEEGERRGPLPGPVVEPRGRAAPASSGKPSLSGVAVLDRLDLDPLSRIFVATPQAQESDASPFGRARAPVAGRVSALLDVKRLVFGEAEKAEAYLHLGTGDPARPVDSVVTLGNQTIVVRPTQRPIMVARNSALIADPLRLVLTHEKGFRGEVRVFGGVTELTKGGTLGLEARLETIDLAALGPVIPRVERAAGTIRGSFQIVDKLTQPRVVGKLNLDNGEFEIQGVPGPITKVHVEAIADASRVTAHGEGDYAGGTLRMDVSAPLNGVKLGAVEAALHAKGLRLTPTSGVAVALDADLGVHLAPDAQSTGGTQLPRVTGDVMLSSVEYTRPVFLKTDLSALSGGARRTVIEVYDPTKDALALDIHVRTRAPLKIKNDLVDLQLGIDSGELHVTGTQQRVGVRGSLKTLPGGRMRFRSYDFDIRQGYIRFEDPTRVNANVDVVAVTEYRRAAASSGTTSRTSSGTSGGTATSSSGSLAGSTYLIQLHAYGDSDNLKVDMSSQPTLSQEDVALLLTVGMTRAELDQLQATSVGASIALNYLGAASGADQVVKDAIPVIDDFRFGSAYSARTGRVEPQILLGKRLTDNLRASVTTGLTEDRELRSNIEWRLGQHLSVQGSYDNITDIASSTIGNVGVGLRWRIEFE